MDALGYALLLSRYGGWMVSLLQELRVSVGYMGVYTEHECRFEVFSEERVTVG